MRGIAIAFRGVMVGAALALVLSPEAMAQGSKAGVVTTLQGTATVARTTTPQPQALKFKDDIFVQDRITTGEESLIRILLGGKAVVTVRERSVLTISETPTTATIEVGSGKIALAVAKERMRQGDSIEIKTPNAVAGIRGTVIVAEVTEDQADRNRVTSLFTLLTGVVDVTGLDRATGRPSGQRVMLQPLQTITVAGFARPGAPRTISRVDAQAIAGAYKVTVPPPPAAVNAPVVDRQVEQGVQEAAAVSALDPKDKAATSESASDSSADDNKGKNLGGPGPNGTAGNGRGPAHGSSPPVVNAPPVSVPPVTVAAPPVSVPPITVTPPPVSVPPITVAPPPVSIPPLTIPSLTLPPILGKKPR